MTAYVGNMSDDAIPAATLVAWRDPMDGAGKPSILVVERSARMAFAAGAVVFPGGRVDEADREFAAKLGRPDDAARITAIRETLEESAVTVGISGDLDPAVGPTLQAELLGGRDFADLLVGHDLRLDLDSLTPFARWKPAFKQPRKFDTLFFVARAPSGDWAPVPQPGECLSAEWAAPSDLLTRIAEGSASAIFPTKRNLERLASHADLASMIADAGRHSLETIIPWVEEFAGEPHVTIPENHGYPVIREPLRTAFRA